MEYNEFNWERPEPLRADVSLSVTDIERMAKLMAELKELTQSRGTYAAAAEFLERFGFGQSDVSLVMPEQLAS